MKRKAVFAFSVLLWFIAAGVYVAAMVQAYRDMTRVRLPPNKWEDQREGCELVPPEVDMENARELLPREINYARNNK